jgi:OOP family OmpA-OmpF porin
MIKRISVASLAVLGLFAGSAFAAEGAGRYTGIAFSQTTISIDDTNFDETGTGYKLFGGIMINKNFGFELAYQDGAHIEQSGTVASLEISPSMFNIEVLGRIPLGERIALFGKVGASFYDVAIEARLRGISTFDSESGTELIYGAGVSLGLGDKFELRAEWEAVDYDIGGGTGTLSMLGIGAVFKF